VEIDSPFVHLHLHSQYSVLNSTASIKNIIDKAKEDKMPAIALTDQGNMYGAFSFVSTARKNKIKPIVGSEFNICKNHQDKTKKDNGYFQVLLAKNHQGYKNLIKLSSVSFSEGFYYVPRIDREVLLKYKENLIALTGNLYSEIPYLILNVGEQQAEEAFKWWHEQFGEDFYVELNRHGLEEENVVNETLIEFAKKYGVKVVAANNVFYINKEDADAQDILVCVQKGEYQSTPKGKGRGYRPGLTNDEYYFKTQEEMKALFADIPEAISNISDLINKVEEFDLYHEPIMPDFPLPEGFENEDEYLKHLTYEGAKDRYGEITDDIKERLDFELETIKKMGYPGYFLIVQDFLNQARSMGVRVGPGRGSAAGSVVAYCTHITDVDPIKFDLLFERFLNPDRISLPDIDIDFDEDGREKVMKWVVDKYGKEKVAQIITFGKMAPKMAIRDVARVKELPLNEADRIAKLVPTKPGISFKKAFEESQELKLEKESDNPLVVDTLTKAEILEGSIRNTGTHACGVIIGRDDLTEHIPIATAKDSDLPVTQFDGGEVETVGMLKMDFLGLKTLSIIKDAVENIKLSKGFDLDINNVPYDDEKTLQLYSRGETIGIFQFESKGMQKYLKELQPNRFEDIIAMNALYRPGPMDYIPSFIKRKHGKENIVYDIQDMEEILKETYGITVYQEQVMLLSQKLAGFTKGMADSLRKGMGKKKKELIDELKPKFFDGCKNNGHDEDKAKKIWDDWEKFASYAFNKSHSTCYAYVSYRMAYLKAHYPAEFMAAVLSRNLHNLDKITIFMDECKRLKIKVLKPDVNESMRIFSVNDKGEIRFGMAAIKGAGEAAVEEIIEEREKNGPFKSIFELTSRVNLRSVNKRCLEALANAGAFDSFENTHRAQYFYSEPNESQTYIDKAIKYGNKVKEIKQSAQQSLFGDQDFTTIQEPQLPECDEWNSTEILKKEEEYLGFFVTAHPLDQYKLDIDNFTNAELARVKKNLQAYNGKQIKIAGIIVNAQERLTKRGDKFGIFTVKDYTDEYSFYLFKEKYLKFKHLLSKDNAVFISGTIRPRFKDSEELSIELQDMTLLSEVRTKYLKKVTLDIFLKHIDETFVENINQVLLRNKGDIMVDLNIKDPDNKMNVNLNVQKYRINPENDFFDEISEMENISIRIN
jgi:DNA polymerase-3 subunit alpha